MRASLIVVLALAGCVGDNTLDPSASSLPRRSERVRATRPTEAARPSLPQGAMKVPLVRQVFDYDCGAAALASVLHYWQVFDGADTDLFDSLHTTPEAGTEPAALVKTARRDYGLRAKQRTGMTVADLRAALGRGETVILDLQAWKESNKPWKDEWDSGHYVVLVGLDPGDDGNVFVMDPSTPATYAWLPIAEFVDRWHDWTTIDDRTVKFVHLGIEISGTTAMPDPPRLGRLD